MGRWDNLSNRSTGHSNVTTNNDHNNKQHHHQHQHHQYHYQQHTNTTTNTDPLPFPSSSSSQHYNHHYHHYYRQRQPLWRPPPPPPPSQEHEHKQQQQQQPLPQQQLEPQLTEQPPHHQDHHHLSHHHHHHHPFHHFHHHDQRPQQQHSQQRQKHHRSSSSPSRGGYYYHRKTRHKFSPQQHHEKRAGGARETEEEEDDLNDEKTMSEQLKKMNLGHLNHHSHRHNRLYSDRNQLFVTGGHQNLSLSFIRINTANYHSSATTKALRRLSGGHSSEMMRMLVEQEQREEEEEEEEKYQVLRVACGDEHMMIQLDDGSIRVRGRNRDGQLGLHDFEDRNNFCQLRNDKINYSSVVKIACGKMSSGIADEWGNIWCCGEYGMVLYNNGSFFRVGCLLGKINCLVMGHKSMFCIVNGCELYGCGVFASRNRKKLSLVNGENGNCDDAKGNHGACLYKKEMRQLACGQYHVCVLLSEWEVYCSSIVAHRELCWTRILHTYPIRQIACGNSFICALTMDHELYTLKHDDDDATFEVLNDRNDEKEDRLNRFVPIRFNIDIGIDSNNDKLGLSEDGNDQSNNNYRKNDDSDSTISLCVSRRTKRRDACFISRIHTTPSAFGTILEMGDGRLFGSGLNDHGQLGLGHNNQHQETFVEIPFVKPMGHEYICVEPTYMFTTVLTGVRRPKKQHSIFVDEQFSMLKERRYFTQYSDVIIVTTLR